MSRRRILPRCERCRLHVPLCMCADLPSLDVATRLVLVPHIAEWRQPSNTGRFAALMLKGAEVALFGVRDRPVDPAVLLGADQRCVLLHPSPSAPLLAPRGDGRPVRLIVPDGSWRRSKRIARKIMELPGIERVRIAAPASAGLRRAPSPDRVGTGEAIAVALDVLGDHEAARELRRVVLTMIDRALWVRGKLHHERVRGGIPIEARRAMC